MTEKILLDGFAVFAGVVVAVAGFAGIVFLWARRRVRTLRARLVMGLSGREAAFKDLPTALLLSRQGVATARVRRRLRLDVEGAVTAVHVAERTGAPIGELGELAALLQVSSESLDEAMASMGPSGVTPVVLARANELSASARRLRLEADHLLASAAVPSHAALVERIGAIGGDVANRRPIRALWSSHTR